ncbi:hypothetical protein RJT34_29768 [Clitoria ternatea]|uniref:Uncharacterized protein n=1 Tax=Clitoria ternatea TaxID=43366 RepID=A0AAN9ETB2_CLITE
MSSTLRGYSRAQMCFFKILHIISSIPPSKPIPIPIDLNLRFSPSQSQSSETDIASIPDQPNDDDDDNNNKVGDEDEVLLEDSEKVLEERENGETASYRGQGENNCLDLLIEAARVVSGKEESESEDELVSRREKRKERWVVVDLYGDVVEEREPVVRSKRGRNQALPCRFRDSIVEPLKRSNRHHRPSSTAHLPRRLLRSSPTT